MTGTVWTVGSWSGTGGNVPTPDAHGSLWYVSSSTGWYESPAPRANTVDREQSDGVFDGPAWQPGRAIGLDGYVVGTSTEANFLASLRDARALLVAGSRTATLTCADADLTLQALVRRGGESLFERQGLAAHFSFMFFAPDPRLYSATLHTATTGLFTGSNGRAYTRVYPQAYGALGNQGYATVMNSGNTDAYPVITVTAGSGASLVNPQVRLVGGSLLRLALTIAPNDYVTLDLGNQTVLLDGVASRFNSLTPDSAFFSCPKGSSQILFTADSGTGATMSVAWRDPYA